jgi:hypothetical protein
MVNDVTLKSKSLYKITLFILKLLPAVIAISYILDFVCDFFNLKAQILTHYIGYIIAPVSFMYLSSYLFRFCSYHRIFIHYIALEEGLNIANSYFDIPISYEAFGLLRIIITVIFLFSFIYLFINKKKERKIKICNYDTNNKKLIS